MKISDLNEAIDSSTVLDHVSRLHSRPEDFDEGDLESRIIENGPYVLRRVRLSDIHSPWQVHDDLVAKYARKTSEPPIVVLDKDLTVIDGGHRVAAAIARGKRTIRAYVGIAEPVYNHDQS